MKRIAIITPCLLPVPASKGGAVENLITRIIEDNERRSEFEIDLYTLSSDGIEDYVYANTNIIPLQQDMSGKVIDRILDKFYRTFSVRSSYRLFDEIITKKFRENIEQDGFIYDAVIIENMMSTACKIVELCKDHYDFPIFFHMHNDVDLYRSPSQIEELVKYGVRFIAVSEYIKNKILKYEPKAVVSVLYNGVDVSYDAKTSACDDGTTTFLYAGRIIPGKGVKELLEAFTKVIESNGCVDRGKLRLIIAGFSGFDRKYERNILKTADKYDEITCINQVSSKDMSALYDKADVVVMPTIDEEPFGLVALETMAKGIPLIVTNSGALPEVVGDGALIVDKNHNFVKNLSDTILKTFFDKKITNKLSECAYKRAHADHRFDINSYFSCFAEIIKPSELKETDKISVIIPVYNVFPYIERCLNSVVEQTYSNLEIILINDGSTDGSGEICDKYAGTDKRIHVIHQDNQGLSAARNAGIDNATGDYIFFCDSDDYLAKDALEKLIKKLKTDNDDITACGIMSICDKGGTSFVEEVLTDLTPGRWSGTQSVIQMMRSNNIYTVAWNKLYKRELFKDIRFPIGVKNEDEATTYKLLYKAKIVSYIPDALYKYFQREASIMHEDLENRYGFFIDAIRDRIAYFHDLGEYDLEKHSRITLLEWIKYTYRNISDKEKKYELLGIYNENLSLDNAPDVMGIKKQMALILWKYIRY